MSVYDPRIILVYMKYTINMHKNMDCWERFMKKHRSWHKKVHQDTTALIPEYYKTMNYEIAYYSKVKQDVAVHKNKREREFTESKLKQIQYHRLEVSVRSNAYYKDAHTELFNFITSKNGHLHMLFLTTLVIWLSINVPLVLNTLFPITLWIFIKIITFPLIC